MKMNPMGRSGIMVSELCLGSMTWGYQNTEAEGHAQIERLETLRVDHALKDGTDIGPVSVVRVPARLTLGQAAAWRHGLRDVVDTPTRRGGLTVRARILLAHRRPGGSATRRNSRVPDASRPGKFGSKAERRR